LEVRVNNYPDHRTLYRLPWSLADNPIAWLEPTETCNIYCDGCYRANVKNGAKALVDVERDLDVFSRYRNFDGVSIAGGDPLTHPDIVRIVERVRERGFKPIVNTNAVALTDTLLKDLASAGLVGFTFHVDSKQRRPGWKGKSETELNALRLELAERVAAVGDISVAFNATVYEDNLPEVPEILEWARRHIDKVHVVVFIAFRQASDDATKGMEFFVQGEKISYRDLVYARPTQGKRLDISSRDIVAVIRRRFPDFSPCAYLNGTEKADSLKWLLTSYVGTRERVFGYAGPRFMEAAQTLHHFRHGRYMAYAPPSVLRRGRSILGVGATFDEGLKKANRAYWSHAFRHPLHPGPQLFLQSVMIIQPIDVLEDGRMNMCDACPDITVHEDELVWSCRLEERKAFGGFARGIPEPSNDALGEPAD
jgi:MoaA/NifB/PqqE/SkfB family radical SAM enzyme